MSDEADGYLAVYQEHSKVLRTWLVAYGIAAPVLLMTHDTLMQRVVGSGRARLMAALFLSGVVLQVLLASLNKATMWTLYSGETDAAFKARPIYKLADSFSEMFWIDLLVDWLTMTMFSIATWLMFQAVLG